eukprot:TRINITY_DN4212_c0_g1_i10.p1 TRINITY_DN4212_c0_g1~~TRINITY_DN4212_c0_g1_i10.p1  ORF type:complete len:587 (-),score=55.18 TRINITY_DN4212_c0_g1_i10:770-2530(-)
MPSFAVLFKRALLLIVFGLFSFFVYDRILQQKPKYKAKHDYAAIYRNSRQVKKAPSDRADLKPKLVYRGTNEKINASDLGLITNIQEQAEYENGFRDHAFNVLVSRRIGRVRDLPDTRHQTCHNKTYDEDLPTVSVIICFYNEHLDTLVRSVESVLRRTPSHLLKEIILVNDGSTHSVEDITYQVKKPAWKKVRQIFTEGRQGLIRARILGARNATAEVLVFLDSHIECNIDWAQPLLQRIKDSSRNVAVPIIDSIDPDTFKYKQSPLVRGGMTWSLHFKWDSLPQGYFDNENKFNEPILSPTMAGGLFAIHAEFFKELGEYDKGLEIWGAENIEISLRIWLCGGNLEIIPCSRIGHVFRKRRPYSSTNARGEDTQVLNVARVAKVWLGDYAKHFYESLPEAKNVDTGDLTERFELKNRLGCKDFSWFHTHVYPQLLLPGQEAPQESKVKFQRWDEKKRNFVESFQIVHNPTGLCVQTDQGPKSKGSELRLQGCMRTKEQTVFLTDKNQLLPGGYLCMDANKDVRLQKCTEQDGPQTWTLPPQRNSEESMKIYNEALGVCLGVKGSRVRTVLCQEEDAQVWSIKTV